MGGSGEIHPGLSVPELIKRIRHSFRDCDYDEIQNTLIEREKNMQIEIENLVRGHDSLKKEIDFLEKTQGYTVLEKFGVEEKLGMSKVRCEELHKEIVGMVEKIRIIICEKLGVEEKLRSSNRKCDEMDERFAKMRREIEELRQQNFDASQIEELMWQEIRTLRHGKMGVEKKLKSSHTKCEEMDERLLKMWREIEELRQQKFDAYQIEELMWKEIRTLRHEKLGVEKKLESSHRKCEGMEEKLLKTGGVIEDLRREKFDANQTMEKLKPKEIEADQAVQDVFRKNNEVSQTTNELRVQKMEFDNAAEVYESKIGGMNLDHPGTKEDAANVVCTNSRSVLAHKQTPDVEVPEMTKKKRKIGYEDTREKKRKTMANLNLTALSKKVNKGKIFSKECFINGVEGDEKHVIYRGLRSTGILPFIRAEPKLFYQQAVAEFYARAKISPCGSVILSTVQNQAVTITRSILAKYFRLPAAGDAVTSYRDGEEELARRKMSSSKWAFLSKSRLKPGYQALSYIAIKMVTGHLGSTSKLSKKWFNVMMALEDGAAIDWASYVFNRLKDLIAQSSYSRTTGDFMRPVGYGMKLSYLLEHMLEKPLSGGRALYVSDFYMKNGRRRRR